MTSIPASSIPRNVGPGNGTAAGMHAIRPRTGLLRGALRGNAFFSAASGCVLALGAPGLDSWVGLPAALLVVIGLGLVGYAAGLWWGAGNDTTLRPTGLLAVSGDIGWVVMAVIVIAATDLLTSGGEWTLAGLSLVVLDFAITQFVGLRRATRQ